MPAIVMRGHRGRLTALIATTVILVSCAPASRLGASSTPLTAPSKTQIAISPSQAAKEQPLLRAPDALVDPQLDLRSPPVAVPLQFEIPSLQVSRPVLAVGITKTNVMDAPTGAAQDPVWQAAFWYRGGGTPGETGTATIAGHVDDSLGRPAIFAHLDQLHVGDPVIVRDLRTGQGITFLVTRTQTYSLNEAASRSVLTDMYGSGPIAGTGPQPSPDGLSHLTLITCTGNFNYNLATHDHRLVVYATRTG